MIDLGIHPIEIADGYEKACQIAIENLIDISETFEQKKIDMDIMVKTCMTSLSSKIVNNSKKIVAEICVRAALAVADENRKDVNFDLIKVEGKVGGILENMTLMKGLVINKEMSHSNMNKRIDNAKIAILTCPFEPPRPKTKHEIEIGTYAQFNILRQIETEYFTDMIEKCKICGANIIICQWGFDDEPNHLLMHNKIPAIRWVSGVDIELLAMATGARIVPRFEELRPSKLGTAKTIREVSFGTSKDKVIFVEGCPFSSAVTILVRGASKIIVDETKRSIHDALCVARNLLKSKKILYGGGAAELSCSLIVSEYAERSSGVIRYCMKKFADSLEQIPLILAENAGMEPIEEISHLKHQQITTICHSIGVDCNNLGTNDMKHQNVLETLIGKKQQILLATQMCKMILKIDDIISKDDHF